MQSINQSYNPTTIILENHAINQSIIQSYNHHTGKYEKRRFLRRMKEVADIPCVWSWRRSGVFRRNHQFHRRIATHQWPRERRAPDVVHCVWVSANTASQTAHYPPWKNPYLLLNRPWKNPDLPLNYSDYRYCDRDYGYDCDCNCAAFSVPPRKVAWLAVTNRRALDFWRLLCGEIPASRWSPACRRTTRRRLGRSRRLRDALKRRHGVGGLRATARHSAVVGVAPWGRFPCGFRGWCLGGRAAWTGIAAGRLSGDERVNRAVAESALSAESDLKHDGCGRTRTNHLPQKNTACK